MYVRVLNAAETAQWHAPVHDDFRTKLRQQATRGAIHREDSHAAIIDGDGNVVDTWTLAALTYPPRSPEAVAAGRLVSEHADARLGLGLGAHAMAEDHRYDGAQDPGVDTAIGLAHDSYRAAAAQYVNAARLYYSGRGRQDDEDLRHTTGELPDPLRTELQHALALGDQATDQPPQAPLQARAHLERLGGIAVQVRDRLEAHAPELFVGREPPFGTASRDRTEPPTR